MAGAAVAAALTVNVNVWVGLVPAAFAAVITKVAVPFVAGIPLMVAVPSPLSVKVKPLTEVPVALSDAAGKPSDRIVKLLDWPTVKEVRSELTIVGATPVGAA